MPKRNVTQTIDYKNLPTGARKTLAHLMSVSAESDLVLHPDMLEEISAISIEGADPEWQIEQMERILSRWTPKH